MKCTWIQILEAFHCFIFWVQWITTTDSVILYVGCIIKKWTHRFTIRRELITSIPNIEVLLVFSWNMHLPLFAGGSETSWTIKIKKQPTSPPNLIEWVTSTRSCWILIVLELVFMLDTLSRLCDLRKSIHCELNWKLQSMMWSSIA